MHLNQIASIKSGYPFRGRIVEASDTGIIAVQMKDVLLDSNCIQWESCVSTALTSKREPDWIQAGDVLIAARGSHNYAVTIDHKFQETGLQVVASPHFFVLRAHQGSAVLPEYLTWLLNQRPCQRYFKQNAAGSLTQSIRRQVLEKAPIAVPSLAKQQSIIRLVDTLRQEKQVVEQLIDNSERLMTSIAADLLSDT